MLKKDSNYRRLKLGGRGMFSTASYWLGKDHLLMVEVANYHERYRRFYFRDVQAIIVQQNNYRLILNVIGGLLATLILVGFLLAMSGSKIDYVALIVLGALQTAPVALLLANNLRGPTCAVHLRTAVQTQRLASISRWEKADLLVAELTPQIQAAQSVSTDTTEVVTEPTAPVELPSAAPPPPAE